MKNCVNRTALGVLCLNAVVLSYSLWELFSHPLQGSMRALFFEQPSVLSATQWIFYPAANFYFNSALPLSAGALGALSFVMLFSEERSQFNPWLFASVITAGVLSLTYQEVFTFLGKLVTAYEALHKDPASFDDARLLADIAILLGLIALSYLVLFLPALYPEYIVGALVLFCLTAAAIYYSNRSDKRNLPLFVMLAVSNSSTPDFFSRALFSPLSSQHSQTYYALTVYFFLAFALCGLLAGLAYLFSISTAQETEKRSEYECGFAPFDSATRLPFDVHFYLVGILFLIFDVEVALLFPWVLALRTTGWFGFYLMFAFLAILTLGFLYEWKRGALIWPTRYSKKSSSAFFALAVPGESTTFQELLTILSSWPGLLVIGIFTLHRLAIVYNWARTKGPVFHTQVFRVLWFIGATLFLCSLYCSYYLSAALAVVFFVSSYLEANPFWPARAYWGAHIIIVSAPIRRSPRPYKALFTFWGAIFAVFFLLGVYWSFIFYTAPVRKLSIPNVMPLIDEFFATSLFEMGYKRMDKSIPALISPAIPAGFNLAAATIFLLPFTAFNALLEDLFSFISPYNVFALLLLFWMSASTIFSYTHGWTSFVFRGVLYQKLAKDPGVSVTMAYLWKEVCICLVCFALAFAIYWIDWASVPMLVDRVMIPIREQVLLDCRRMVEFVLSVPERITNIIQSTQEAFNRALKYGPVVASGTWTVLWVDYLKPLPAFLWRFWYLVVWILYGVRGYYYMEYIHDEEDEDTFAGSVHMILASFSYTFIVPWFRLCYFLAALYRRVRAALSTYYTQRTAAATPEAYTQLSTSTKVEAGESPTVKSAAPVIIRYVVVDSSGRRTGEDYATVLSDVTAGFKRMFSQVDELASLQIYCEDLDSLRHALMLTAACLFIRGVQLAIRWLTRAPIPASAPAQLIKKYTWAPRKASFFGWLLNLLLQETHIKYFVNSSRDLDLINTYLAEQLTLVKWEISFLYSQLAALAILCLCLLIVNCYLSRKCQHHEALINGILTDGALVVVTIEKNKTSRPTKSFLFLTASAESTELLFSPMLDELFTVRCVDYPLLAEVVLFLLICGVITKLSSDLGKEHNKRVLAHTSWKILTRGLVVVMFVYLFQLSFDASSATILGGYFATSRTIILLKLITLISVVVVLDASETFMRQHSRHLLEYPIMVVLTTFFMLLLISANHVMSTFLSLVGFSLGLYVLILYDANKRPSREAGLKYYYLSTLSSGFVLYGILLVYTLTGTGNFDELFLLFNTKLAFQENALLWTAVLFILAGFFFKLSAFPGHLWAADVYEGSPSPIVAFFMLPVKIVVLAAFIRLFSIALAPLAASWLPLLTLAVIISIGWGALASVQEKKVRRFLAYASINQMGFLLMGLTTDSDEGYQAALLYITIYAVMTSAFLGIFLSARRQDGSELLYVSDFRTLASRNWLVGWSLAIVLFSMAGIPPLGGFFSKYLVLLHAFEKGLMVEVIVGLATSLISTYYYLRIIKIVKFEQPDGAMPSSPCLTTRRQNQLFFAEALLWSFIAFAPAILGLTYTLALAQGPACL